MQNQSRIHEVYRSSSCWSVFTLCHPNLASSCYWQLSATWNSGCWSISGNMIPRRHLFTRKEANKISFAFSPITSWNTHAECWDSTCILNNLQYILGRCLSKISCWAAKPKISEWQIMSEWRWRKKSYNEVVGMWTRQTPGWNPDASCGLRWNTAFYRVSEDEDM